MRHALHNVICDTSPLQYLYQLDVVDILPALTEGVFVPPAVEYELAVGRSLGVYVPDVATLEWITIRRPVHTTPLPGIPDLGPGETEVLLLTQELPESVAVLDDALARQVAQNLNLRVTGTLGLLIDAKRVGLIPLVEPLLDQLQALRFRLAAHTRRAVLKLAGEDSG